MTVIKVLSKSIQLGTLRNSDMRWGDTDWREGGKLIKLFLSIKMPKNGVMWWIGNFKEIFYWMWLIWGRWMTNSNGIFTFSLLLLFFIRFSLLFTSNFFYFHCLFSSYFCNFLIFHKLREHISSFIYFPRFLTTKLDFPWSI